MLTHKQRTDKVRAFIDKNKLFTVAVIVAIFIITGNIVRDKVDNYKANRNPDTSISTSSESEESVDTSINQTEKEKPQWRFYWTDLWILVGGGGFCVFKVIQERKKAREKL